MIIFCFFVIDSRDAYSSPHACRTTVTCLLSKSYVDSPLMPAHVLLYIKTDETLFIF
jgi:hypothetical protein